MTILQNNEITVQENTIRDGLAPNDNESGKFLSLPNGDDHEMKDYN